jgi:hypothetical protein
MPKSGRKTSRRYGRCSELRSHTLETSRKRKRQRRQMGNQQQNSHPNRESKRSSCRATQRRPQRLLVGRLVLCPYPSMRHLSAHPGSISASVRSIPTGRTRSTASRPHFPPFLPIPSLRLPDRPTRDRSDAFQTVSAASGARLCPNTHCRATFSCPSTA